MSWWERALDLGLPPQAKPAMQVVRFIQNRNNKQAAPKAAFRMPFVDQVLNQARQRPATQTNPRTPTNRDRWDAAYSAYQMPGGVTDPMLAALQAQQERNRQRQSDMRGQYDRTMAEMLSRYNFGEDPYQRSLRDNSLADLANQLSAAQASIGQSYDRGRADLQGNAQEMRSQAAAQGANLAGLFTAGAGAVDAGNATTGAAYAGDYGMLGAVGPAQGAAVDMSALLAAAAPREQALAESIGQTYANTADTLASLMSGYAASEQAATGRDAASMRQNINAEFGRREAERIARERESYENMAAQLASQMMGYQQEFAGREDDLLMSMAQRQAEPFDLARELYQAQNIDRLMNVSSATPDPGDTSMYNRPLTYMNKDGVLQQVPGVVTEQAIRTARIAASSEAGDNDPDTWNQIFLAVLQENLGPAFSAIDENWLNENLRRR
jgi:hypothetical protein